CGGRVTAFNGYAALANNSNTVNMVTAANGTPLDYYIGPPRGTRTDFNWCVGNYAYGDAGYFDQTYRTVGNPNYRKFASIPIGVGIGAAETIWTNNQETANVTVLKFNSADGSVVQGYNPVGGYAYTYSDFT
ncbi:hypothetical protein, partial [Salmonella enterica]|uniref:hypothetical protein n=1 Tax=Salmonella enterica TaxID=28901 RepID=UPI00139C473C